MYYLENPQTTLLPQSLTTNSVGGPGLHVFHFTIFFQKIIRQSLVSDPFATALHHVCVDSVLYHSTLSWAGLFLPKSTSSFEGISAQDCHFLPAARPSLHSATPPRNP